MLKLSKKFFPVMARSCQTLSLEQLMYQNPPRDIEIFTVYQGKSCLKETEKPKIEYEDEMKPNPDYNPEWYEIQKPSLKL